MTADTTSGDCTVPGLDVLIRNFSNFYRINVSFRSSAFVGIMSALITKITEKGTNNPQWNDKALNLCMLINDQSPKAYSIFLQNLVGVSDRQLRRLRGSSRDVHKSVLELGSDKIAARLKNCLDLAAHAMIQRYEESSEKNNSSVGSPPHLPNECHGKVAYSIAFDGTTVPPVVQTCAHVAGVVGMCAPNHIRRPVDDESIKTIFLELAKLPKEQLANEALIAVISFQIPNEIMSPMALLTVQPHRVNIKSDFIQRVVEIAVASSSGIFLGYSGDGAHAAEIRKDQMRFLDCKINYIAQQDINHAMKNYLGALVGGTQLLTAAGDIIDNGLLRVSGVPKEIWCRKDFASDGLVLKATSNKTMMGILQASNEECGSKAMLVLTLAFIRVFLFSVHGEEVDCKQRVIGIWAAMLFLTSVKNLNVTTKRNLMACAVGAVFAAFRADVINMSAIFEEPAEHMFAGMRGFFKMFTIADVPILDEKVQRRVSALVKHGITSQASDRSGGYAAGTLAYMQRNARMLLRQQQTVTRNKRPRTESTSRPTSHHDEARQPLEHGAGGLHIDPSKPVAAQIAPALLPILSAVSRGMKNTMRQLGFEECELCPFMLDCSFLTLTEFTKAYNLSIMMKESSRRDESVDNDTQEQTSIGTSASTSTSATSALVEECLADLFDNFRALEVDEETEESAAMADAMGAAPLINEDDSSPPAMDLFLNTFLDLSNIPNAHRGDTVMPKWHLAVSGMHACKVSTLGSRERGHVGTEMHYQQLNMRWFGTSRAGTTTMAETPQLLDSLKRNVLFQIKDSIYRVLTVYSKTYNKWLEVDSVPMSHLSKSTNLYKVHARRLVEDVLSFTSSRRKFSPALDRIELLTTGHAIASGTIIGDLDAADGNVLAKMMNDETKV